MDSMFFFWLVLIVIFLVCGLSRVSLLILILLFVGLYLILLILFNWLIMCLDGVLVWINCFFEKEEKSVRVWYYGVDLFEVR